mgnify:FL=1|jgi:hypothetical protein
MRLTILNYETGKVYQLTSIPSQEYIDKEHGGDWEDFLNEFYGDIYNSSCYYMTHENEDVHMINKRIYRISKHISEITEKKLKEIIDNTDSKLWARVCNITGEGMNKGYVLYDSETIKYEKDLIKELRKGGDEEYNKASDEFILKEAYENEDYYWTEWDCESDLSYMEDSQGNITAINE